MTAASSRAARPVSVSDRGRGGWTVTVPPDAQRVGQVRRLGTARLRYWGLDSVADDVALLISEMVANAIQHGDGGPIMVALSREEGAVRVEVHDGSHRRPRVRRPQPDEESGRGMLLVAGLSSAWGTSADGTSTWCTVPAPATSTR